MFKSSQSIEFSTLPGHKIETLTLCESSNSQEALILKSSKNSEKDSQPQIFITIFINSKLEAKQHRFQLIIKDEKIEKTKGKFNNFDLTICLILKSKKIYILHFEWKIDNKTFIPSIKTFEGHLSQITTGYFYSKNIFLTTSLDCSAIFWDISLSKNKNFSPQIACFIDNCDYKGHPSCILNSVLLKFDKKFVITDALGFLKIFDIKEIEKLFKEKSKFEDEENFCWKRKQVWKKSDFAPFKFNNIIEDMTQNDDLIYCFDINRICYLVSLDYKEKKFNVARILKLNGLSKVRILPHKDQKYVSFVSQKKLKTKKMDSLDEEDDFEKIQKIEEKEYFTDFEYEDERHNLVLFVSYEESTPIVIILEYT